MYTVNVAQRDHETEDYLLHEWKQEMRKTELLKLAEKLGCNIYLAARLRNLREKLELVMEVLGNRR